MDRQRENERMRQIVIGTVIGLLIAGALLVVTYLWLFRKLLN
jgi:cell division septal protein FtsQ